MSRLLLLGVIELGVGQLVLAAAMMLLAAGASLAMRLGLGGRLLLAALRSVVQLMLLGLVLKWIFASEGPWMVLAMMVLMALIAGFEAVRRTTYRMRGVLGASMGVMLLTSMVITFYGVVAVIRVDPLVCAAVRHSHPRHGVGKHPDGDLTWPGDPARGVLA